jgi:replicative DNA helicase
MSDVGEIKDKALTTMLSDYDVLVDVLERGTPVDIFVKQPEDKMIINELRAWHKKYRTKPSMSKIMEKLNTENHDKYLIIKTRITPLKNIKIDKNEFPYLVEQLKHKWATTQVESNIKSILLPERPYNTLDEYAGAIKNLASKLFTTHSDVTHVGSSGESFTTLNVEENINLIKTRDTSGVRRFHLGHDPLDDATGGFLPGEVLMIVGNVNQGKSMVLANMAYHTWYHDKANVLILTAEMQPEMFDQRIYSRASAVEYSHILSGKDALSPAELKSLDTTVNEMKNKDNQIIVRWLDNSDNVNSVAKIIDDYEKLHNFIPDILIIDSLECLTPAGGATGKDWEDKGQVVIEFKNFAETFRNGRKIFVISTHQAKTATQEKEFKDIDITDMGRSKIVAEKADAAFYLRCQDDRKRMQIKTIKARRFSKELSWDMAYDFSRVLITNIINDSIIE